MKPIQLNALMIVFFTCCFLFSFSTARAQSQQKNPSQLTQSGYSYKVIDAPDHTYGYDIYSGSKLLVHQASIPALPGNKGFATKKDAGKVAELVIEKIKKGITPPTVTKEELQKLKVIP